MTTSQRGSFSKMRAFCTVHVSERGDPVGEHVTRKAVLLIEKAAKRSLPLVDKRKFRQALYRRMSRQPRLAPFEVHCEFRGRTANGWDVWRCTDKASGTWIEGYFPSYSRRLTVHDQGERDEPELTLAPAR